LTSAAGTWGALTLLREAKRPHFTAADVRFVASVAGLLADGLRRAMLLGASADGDHDAGVLVLAADHTIEMANRAADQWLDELGALDRPGLALPVVVYTVAERTRRGGGGRVIVRTSAGRWVVVRGSLLGEGAEPKVAILLEAAQPPEMRRSSPTPTSSPNASGSSPSWWRRDSRPLRSRRGCTCRPTPCRTT
jgi:hypothetical protein